MGQRNKHLRDSKKSDVSSSTPKINALSTPGKTLEKEPAKQKVRGIEELALEKIAQNNNVKLGALVDELTQDLGYKRDRVLNRLMELEAKKKIVIQEKTPYRSFFNYAVSTYSLWFWGAAIATLLSLVLISATGGVALYLRYAFGGLLILFLPGYSLIEFLYAKKKELDELTRVALSIGLSLAIVPLVGLALNYTPFGIRLVPVALSLTLVTLILLLLALRKKHSYYKVSKDVI